VFPKYGNLRLGDLLISDGAIDKKQLYLALQEQKKEPGKRLGAVLVEMGATTDIRIRKAMAQKLGIPSVDLMHFDVDSKAMGVVPRHKLSDYVAVPICFAKKGSLVVAMSDPLDAQTIKHLEFQTGHQVEPVIADRSSIMRLIKHGHAYVNPVEEDDEDTAINSAAPTVVRVLDDIIRSAVQRGASDIHFVPDDYEVEILYRIDGTLISGKMVDISLLKGLAIRIKSLAKMDVTKKHLPQDGHARWTWRSMVADLRVSTVPTPFGESIVMRIHKQDARIKTMLDIGMEHEDVKVLGRITRKDSGIFLMCGPTGSGKTTTLNSMLNELVKKGRKVITIEDPVEYRVHGAAQIQINEKTGYDFNAALKHVVRQDPDVIMVGEIRDAQTAKTAIHAAMTGHLVLSTLHASNAAEAVIRLMEMGVDNYLIRSSLLGVMSQRLLRTNCPHCSKDFKLKDKGGKVKMVVRQGNGCISCEGTGFKGRALSYELMEFNKTVREALRPTSDTGEIHSIACSTGMQSITSHAMGLVKKGAVPLGEATKIRMT